MTSSLEAVQTADGKVIFIEADTELGQALAGQPGFTTAGAADKAAELASRLEDLSSYLTGVGEKFLAQYLSLPPAARPAKVGIDFAIGIEGGMGILFLAMAKGKASATLKVEWSISGVANSGS
jgi:hypothetical protein